MEKKTLRVCIEDKRNLIDTDQLIFQNKVFLNE